MCVCSKASLAPAARPLPARGWWLSRAARRRVCQYCSSNQRLRGIQTSTIAAARPGVKLSLYTVA